MQITDHLLSGDGVSFTDSPNKGGPIVPQYLVIHYTAGRDAESSVRHFLDPGAAASAHLVIGRDGRLWQLVPFNRKAWHAGKSAWLGLEGMNRHSIGIELDNAGRLTQVGTRYQAWFGAFYPESEVVRARHKNETADAWWHAYTEAQLSATLAVARLLVRHYGLKDVLGHDDIAPGRKADPGPAFRMASFRSNLFGRGDDGRDRLVVNAPLLNIRGGPGAEHPLVAAPLKAGTSVDLIEMAPLWAHVALADGSGLEGWVRNSFVVPAP
ncbi:MAG: N-acetylmuramoyl-L-alanine amidase [Betaproteobacteria bacterium]|jgi:N-acetylmuramoyl-L-alanine amidase|nr:N-acetylmuramoyl-L-alanine amidase [Rhodocyclaceae bacterium]MCE2896753.1 N-acetylmuramoyl-L-alanine amidase [Betaproteobacteria bacterium]